METQTTTPHVQLEASGDTDGRSGEDVLELQSGLREGASQLILLSEIAVSDRIRKKINLDKVNELAKSLMENGQLQSIVVRRPDAHDDPAQVRGKPWVLVIGGRRVMAATLMSWTHIRAEDLGAMTPYIRLKVELEENLQREEMHFADIAETKLRLHELYQTENPKQQISDTARAIGETVANTSRDLALAKALRTNPNLRNASSKKAALHSVKMEEFGRARQMDMATKKEIMSFQSKIVTADMKDWLRLQGDASADLVMTDLPYGIDYFDMPVGDTGDLSKYDDSKEVTKDLVTDVIPQLLRVTKVQGWLAMFTGWEGYFHARSLIAQCCTRHFEYVNPESKDKLYCYGHKAGEGKCSYLRLAPKPWIWYRPNSRNNSLHPDLHAQNQYEPILVVNRGEGKIVSEVRVGNVLVHDADYGQRIHEMQKPIPVWEDILERLTLMGAMVYDPCFGSATSLAACAKSSRDFKGCELNPGLLGPARGMVAQFYKESE